MKLRRILLATSLSFACFVLVCVIIVPILWGLLISLKTRVDALSTPPRWIFTPTLANYQAAFVEGPYAQPLLNSLVIAATSSVLAMLLGTPAAYAFSRSRFKGRRAAFLSILTVRLAPATIIALPLFRIFTKLQLIDSYAAIILVHTGVSLPIAVWIMKGFIDEVPLEVDEASLLDGDSRFGAMMKQVLPICIHGLLVTAAFCFINSWNEFFLALMLTGYESRPFTVAVPALVTPHGTYWGQVTAISTVALCPGLLFAVFARRYLVREVTGGAVWR